MDRSVIVRRAKYLTSHLLAKVAQLAQMKPRLSTECVGLLSTIILLTGLGIGIYNRWHHTQDIAILVVAFTGLFVFSISCALIYYFSMETFGLCLARLWIGCLLGMISFTGAASFEHSTAEQVMNILIMTSLGIRCFWKILERFLHINPPHPFLLNKFECLELLGMAIATLVLQKGVFDLCLLVIAFGVNVSVVRFKSFLAIINLVVMVLLVSIYYLPKFVSVYYVKDVPFTINAFALSCFGGRIAFEPLIDVYFSGFTTLERWQPLLHMPKYLHRLLILGLSVIQITFFAVHAGQIPTHKEWFVVVPIFAVFSLVWFSFHLILFITCWQFTSKVAVCNMSFNNRSTQATNFNQILASKGVRHLSLIAQRLVLITFLCSVILGGIAWTTRTGASLALWFTVLPLEGALITLLWEMGSSLGGTCTGYAVVAPIIEQRSSDTTSLLPANVLQESSNKATSMLNLLQRFFSHHLIDTYGCDYSSSGLSTEALRTKLSAFFQRCTPDGPRYDTYLVYYSGPVHASGDWALAGEEQLKLEDILDWWQDITEDSDSRLILILDTPHSHRWLRSVQGIKNNFVALQTCLMAKGVDPENAPSTGDFTKDWITYNCCSTGSDESDIFWGDKDRTIKPVYTASYHWTDFTFHLPTEEDINQYWDANFPKVIKPLMRALNFPQIGQSCCCFSCVMKCLRRKKMSWLPPRENDTGHGFKLIKS